MKKFLYFIIFINIISCFVGCKTTKQTENNIYKELDSNYIEKIKNIENIIKTKEKETYILQDSLIYIKGLLEKSKSIGLDSSFLETSYAWSIAKINKEGKLEHSLQNKDSIPSKISKEKISNEKIKNKVNNTNLSEKQQKIKKIYYKVTKIRTIKEKITFLEKLKYISIGTIVGIILIILILILYYKKHS